MGLWILPIFLRHLKNPLQSLTLGHQILTLQSVANERNVEITANYITLRLSIVYLGEHGDTVVGG